MRKILFLSFLIPLVFINISGCLPLVVGTTVGALGGYAISKDIVQCETDKPYETLWNSALTVSKIRGRVKQEDIARGYIELEADSSLVRINVVRLTRTTNRLKIFARKYGFPNLSLAEDLFVKILEGAR